MSDSKSKLGCGPLFFGAIVVAIIGGVIGGVIGAIDGSQSGMGLWKVIDEVVINGWSISDSWANHRRFIIKGAISGVIKGAILAPILGGVIAAINFFREPEGGDGASEAK